MIREIILLICLLIILSFMVINVYNIQFKESFQIDNLHICPPNTYVHNAFNSYKSLSKGWCTKKSYSYNNEEDIDKDLNKKSKIKCPENYKRVNALDSYKSESKGFCKLPDSPVVYE